MRTFVLRQIVGLLALSSLAASFDLSAKPPSMPAEPAVITFARDFSGNDPELVTQAAAFVAQPPTDLETIGFYDMEQAPARSRSFLATANLLGLRGKLYEAEDKYTYELLYQWKDEGFLDAETLPPSAKAVFGPLLNESLELDAQQRKDYQAIVWSSYAQATEELEQHFAAQGKVLLSIDTTGGDTLFFALVEPTIAERWRNKALARDHHGYLAGVRAPLWDQFWDHLTYALRGLLVKEGQQGYPPGTRQRDEGIPLLE